MKFYRTSLRSILVLPLLLWLIACSDGSDKGNSEAQELLSQFGIGAVFFSEAGLQGLLNSEGYSSPVTLLQIMSVTDDAGFAQYESDLASVLEGAGAQLAFASRVSGRLLGERELNEVRAIDFPNIAMLIDTLRSEEFKSAMVPLFNSTSDHTWTLGTREVTPPKFTGTYADPALQGINREEAIALLAAQGSDLAGSNPALETNQDVIIDMIVSDSPEPFYMVNLIDYYELAHYTDGRENSLTGLEANALYAQSIAPLLFAYQSGPELLLAVQAVLTRDSIPWERAAIVRYASRDAFLTIFPLNTDVGDAVVHKDASVENTWVYATDQRHATPPEPVNGLLFNLRYCEILLVKLANGINVEVWGTQGLNFCPQEQWDAIDRDSLAASLGATATLFNGPRYFVVDWASNTEGLAEGDSVLFDGLEMQLLTTVMPAALAGGESGYNINRVARGNIWHFVAGRRVYEMENPEGERFIMQSFSIGRDPTLQLEDLATLGARLQLPPGWQFHTRILTQTLAVPAIDGIAQVVQDDLGNTYQRVP